MSISATVPSARMAWARKQPGLAVCLSASLLVASGLWTGCPSRPEAAPTPTVDPEWRRTFEHIEAVEEALRELTAPLHHLAAGVRNLDLRGTSEDLPWAPTVQLQDLDALQTVEGEPAALSLPRLSWSVAAAPTTSAKQSLDPWRPLLDTVSRFDGVHFGTKRGAMDTPGVLDADLAFSATAWHRDGRVLQLKGKLHSGWRRVGEGDQATWELERLEWVELAGLAAKDLLFEEVLDRAIPDPETLATARRCLHEEKVAELMALSDEERQARTKGQDFQPVSGAKHPGLAVVDIDSDGWDDLYVMPRIGRNQLLRNRRDGTFEDVAARYGLDLDSHCAAALFADFDNDGDLDVFVGRTVGPSLYLTREGDTYRQDPERVDAVLPSHVTSIAAADVNGDGLLDVYISTYLARAQKVLHKMSKRGEKPDSPRTLEALSRLVPREVALGLAQRFRSFGIDDIMRDRPGPPNMLLLNAGEGRFAPAPAGDHEVWRNTFQASFADIDDDGDQDLYVANDFAPNTLLRNDGGHLVDVTAQTGASDEGFGMGASWGDYDGDGDLDLYVTNMYSKAGRRITTMAGDKGAPYAHLARGNTLLKRGAGLTFERVSGSTRPAMEVEAAGWGWGGQFLDVNNDGWLDIYAGAGFYTAPPGFRSLVDT